MAKKTGLEALKAKATLVGVDIDQVKAELVREIIKELPPPVDEAALIDKAVLAVEGRISSKLNETIAAFNAMKETIDDFKAMKANEPEGSGVDYNAIVASVVEVLNPKIGTAVEKYSKDLKDQLQQKFEQEREKIQQIASQQREHDQENPGPLPLATRPGFNFSLAELVEVASKAAEAYAKIRPPQPTVSMADELSRMYRFNKLFDDLRRADVDVGTFDKKVHETFPK